MPRNRSAPPGAIVPSLYYDDVGAAADWLCAAFGFVERVRLAGDDGRATLAQLHVGMDGAIMLGRPRIGQSPDWDDRTPIAPPGGAPLQVVLTVRVVDVDTHHEHARAFGARVLHPPADYPFGERQYTAEDLAGYRWTFTESIADVDPAAWGAVASRPK